MNDRQTDAALSFAGIIAITVLTCYCIHEGIDHTLIRFTTAVIAALAGFTIRGLLPRNKP